MFWSGINEGPKGTFCPSPRFSHCAALSSLLFCSMNSGLLGLFKLPNLFPQFKRIIGFHLVPLFPWLPWLRPENPLKTVSWGNDRTRLIFFSSLRDHFPMLPHAQCLKRIIWFLNYFRPKVELVPDTPSLPE